MFVDISKWKLCVIWIFDSCFCCRSVTELLGGETLVSCSVILCFVISLRWWRAQMMTPPTWSNSSLHSEQTWRHASKMPTLYMWKLLLEPDSRSSSVYPDLTELTEGTEGCWRETCGSNNIRATREKVGPVGASSECDCEQEEDSAENSVVDTEQSPPSVQRPVH